MTHLTFKKYFCCDILLYTEILVFVKGFFIFFEYELQFIEKKRGAERKIIENYAEFSTGDGDWN